MLVADPHCHTLSSDGMVTPAQLVDAAVKAKLDLIAVTDHDTMESVKETQARGEAAGIVVIGGQEITTGWPGLTHILGWFLDRPVRSGMSIEDTVDAIHDQGALAIVPHPFMPLFFASIQPQMLRRLIERRSVEGIEIMSTVPIGSRRRRELEDFYARHSDRLGAEIGGSDCHFGAHDIGSVVTQYEGDFRSAVLARTTVPSRLRTGTVPRRLAARQQVRSLIELPFRRLTGQL